MAGLVTAHTAVRAGADVVLLEAGPVVGGLVRAHQVAGIALDAGAESFATRGGHVGALAEELDLPVLTPRPAPARVLHSGRLHPRSEERRVGKEGRTRRWRGHDKH